MSRTPPDVHAVTRSEHRRRLIAGGIGNFMEWFDFAIYGFFAAAIGTNFFPSTSSTASLLSALAVYAIAFLMRPVGGLVIGAIGDRRGRRFALMLSVGLMGAATALIAVLPPYSAIGIAAPAVLVLLRCVQGFSAGGEWTGSTAFLVENAPAGRRGLVASVVPMTGAIGVAAGAGSALLIQNLLAADQIATWGWRIPFLAAFPLTLVGLYIRIKLDETAVFHQLRARDEVAEAPIRTVLRAEKRGVAISFALSAITVLGFYYIATYVVTFLTTTAGMKRGTALWVVSAGALVYSGLCVVAGALSDRVGRRPISLAGGAGLALFAIPAFLLMATGRPGPAILGIVLFGVFQAMHISTTTVMLIELFPARTRMTGSAIGYNLGAALIAGPGPLIAAALAATGGFAGLPATYIAVVAAICSIALFFLLPETRFRRLGGHAADPDPRRADDVVAP
ncbi:MFS transporter [Amycolatopsis pithecellobii]|uniref:Putative proline/betaine transporter n=1 Tax=Amycolatopsis pithecellobii TaxID=664692 RepID=A0A6N7Z5G6_9PSEU|nr:MFS transporter [Amycolatopsis pithecellobii]MTD54706.1 MFS transporter [Amycolatopsis pithecellobii]